MNARPNQIVLDAGGGGSCRFARRRRVGGRTKIIAVDFSAEELAPNRDVDGRVAADLVSRLPFGDGRFDLVASRSVLEHLADLEGFIAEAHRVLRSGGLFINVFACRFAPFALINRALPSRAARLLVQALRPGARGTCGFPAFYDRCYESAFAALVQWHGFETVEVCRSHYQSRYFDFFAPAYVLSCAYELLIRAMGIHNLCAYLLVVARRK